jgi:hypothetical protein
MAAMRTAAGEKKMNGSYNLIDPQRQQETICSACMGRK